MSCIVHQTGGGLVGSSLVIYGRIENRDREPFTQAQISSLTFKSYDISETTELSADNLVYTLTPAPDKADVFFDTLFAWDVDKIGGNYTIEVDVAAFPEHSKTYRLVLTVTPQAGQPVKAAWDHTTI